MTRRSRIVLLIAAGGVVSMAGGLVAGCMQSFDPASDQAGPVGSSDSGVTSPPSTDTTCPPGEVCSQPSQQCTLDSPQCFYLCGSPLCANGPNPNIADAGPLILPDAATVPPIFIGSTDTQVVADGSTTTDPCVQIEAASVEIRQRSCAPCHSTTATSSRPLCSCTLNYIMDDQMLIAKVSPDYTLPDGSGPFPYITPGNPASSLIWYRIVNQSMPIARASADAILGVDAAAALVYPTNEDVSILSQWITTCLNDGGIPGELFGGGLNGSTCFGPCQGDGGTPAPTPSASAAATTVAPPAASGH
jgi:hypothetical protein